MQPNAPRRTWSRLTAGLVGATLAVATVAPVTAQESPKVTIWGWPTTMAGFFDTDSDTLVARLKAETGIDAELVLTEQNELGAKLKASLPAGQGPDILFTDFDVMNPYWQFMEPLDDRLVAEWGADWRSQFSGASMDELQLVSEIAGKDGQALYLPTNVQLLGWLLYDRDAWATAGLDASALTSFDDLMAACATLKAADKTAILVGGHPAGLVDLYQSFVEISAPGKMELAQRGQASFTDADMTAAFDLITRLYSECAQEGAIAATVDAALFSQLFSGQAATAFQFTGTPWFGFVNDEAGGGAAFMAERAGTFPMPGSKGLAATDAGIGVVGSSANKDAAWEVVKWLAAGDENARIAERGEPMAFVAHPPAPKGTDFDTYVQQPLIDALATGDNKFRRVLCADVYNTLGQVIPGVVQGQIDAATAGQEVQDAFDRGCDSWVVAS
ncbi:MAG: carbohydrate ABC transporter substrate-binding protein [Chloroflexi bacterium]|nr:carbohydrate ABC transporter substrate-binding protein [Chloroflexota bacterium]